ncbi:MAG: hypothetical protein A2Y79_11015 [Deltaproteobacteria bacterium RBG_13_43_22]|nr:MAG: hypothetical protein A2Y79_11015 [Deltaproteobacteria bacterium RBG_13_43_22]
MAILKAKDLDYGGWKSLIAELSVLEGTRMIVESIGNICFEWFDKERVLIENCIRGRIFNPQGELKWRRIGDVYRTVFLGDIDWAGGILIDSSQELQELISKKEWMVLWGNRTDFKDEWLEQSIPQYFNYPFQNGVISRGRLKLITENWYDFSGRLVFVRYLDLEEMEGENATR